MAERHLYTNRLIREKSPYLLQHAHNPVDWYPWGNEAFQAAHDQDKPIFLSIGYATCHWCHVMEKESFENSEMAGLMNDTFINIKIDREELPEIDSLYMEFAQSMMAGSAGWPLNVILTPDLRPFFAATYLPPKNSHGLMGLEELIERIHEVWTGEERERIVEQAEKIVEVFAQSVHVKGDDMPHEEQIEDAAELLFKMADPIYGGMKGAPKFPVGYQSNFMIRYSSRMKDGRALFIVERTLDMMQRGGIYDHLGGGFSRYSIDEKWIIPHFEKMLYDNALLVFSYLEAWQVTKKPIYQQISKEILNYIIRDMTHPEGGYYSAEDADSEGHEGYFYTWPYEEVFNSLPSRDLSLFCEYFQITPEGNFEGRNILHTPLRIEEYAKKKELDFNALSKSFENDKEILWKNREERIHPLKDDKILSSWNGLMIFAMAEAGMAFAEPRFSLSAVRSANFIKNHLWKNGLLQHRWRENEILYSSGLDDYAFMIRGLLSLFETNCGTEWLSWSIDLTNVLEEKFKEVEGAFYQTDGSSPDIILRKSQFSDGAEPSGNAIHCENLLRLYQITGQRNYLEQAEDILKAVKRYLDTYSPGYCYHLMNLQHYYNPKIPTFVIALNDKQQYADELGRAIYQTFLPHKAVIWRRESDEDLQNLIPFVNNQAPIQNRTTLYVCYEGVCKTPLTDLNEMLEAIRKA